MKKYLINNLTECEYDAIITLLDYETQISTCLKPIKMSTYKTGKILIDTALCSGMNGYRFIETTLNDNGTIDLGEYSYVDVNSDMLQKANEIIKEQPAFLENSVLTKSQIEELKNKQ